MNGTFDEIQG